MYSRAVQVFSLLAVEASLNEYGYICLGQELFEMKFQSLPIVKNPSALLMEVLESSTNDSEIVAILRRLSEERNRLVHPRPEMEAWNDNGTVYACGPCGRPGHGAFL
jgi:hypothetical protein